MHGACIVGFRAKSSGDPCPLFKGLSSQYSGFKGSCSL